MNHPYTFDALPQPVVSTGEFSFAAVGLDHGHIYGMTDGLVGAGATVTWVFDRDAEKAAAFAKRYPTARVASSEQEILDDPDVRLVATAAVASERAPIGLRAIEAGKDAFVDKAPLTSFDQLDAAREATARTGRRPQPSAPRRNSALTWANGPTVGICSRSRSVSRRKTRSSAMAIPAYAPVMS